MTVDASEHIGVLHHVVKSATMNIPEHLQDEALSEGMVLLVQAAKSYDPKHGVPVHYWLAKKLRWGLLNWKMREVRAGYQAYTFEEVDYLIGLSRELRENADLTYDAIGQHDIRLELEHLVELAGKALDDQEYIAIFGPAFGLHMKELSHILEANPNQIKAMQERGRTRINEMRML